MEKMRYLILTIAGLIGLISTSCINDEITTSSADILTFSRDTVDFDTVFTDLGTPTARLVVRNKASKGLMISSIKLKKPDSYFSINVDGVSGKDFHDVEIRANDSIYLFIECLLPSTSADTPFLEEDAIEFVTNGVRQEVRLEAYGQNVTRLRGLKVETDLCLTADRPYVIFDTLVVAEGARLRVEPGARLLFHNGARLRVKGTFEAVGGVGKMIDMRGDRLDNVLPGVSYDIMAGQWDGIIFEASSFNNRMEYVDMRSTVNGVIVDSCGSDAGHKLLLRNSWLHNSQGNVLKSSFSRVDAYGCCFSEAAGSVVDLRGGAHTFTQCTIANNYLFSAISGPLLGLSYLFPDEKRSDEGVPLMKATFNNCIIYGLAATIEPEDLKETEVFLRNVLLKSKGADDDNFIDCLWEEDPLFYTIRNEYYFNYRLQPGSPAIGAGNPEYVGEESLYDMDGLNRLADGNPALGAYVYEEPAQRRALKTFGK